MREFPKNFIFGGATSAYQAEGESNSHNKGPNYWDEYYARPDSTFNAKHASDFYNKYKEDLQNSASLGINGIRISIAWTRILPDGTGKINKEGVEFYHKLIDECIANGVEPYVTLHHFDTPLPQFKTGDWLNKQTIKDFLEFSKICFKEFGSKVTKWISINEPFSVVAGQYIIGHFPPNIKYDLVKASNAMHNMAVAHAELVKYFKQTNQKGEIGIVHILEGKYPISSKQEDIQVADRWDTFANKILLDSAFKGGLTKQTKKIVDEILKKHNANFSNWVLPEEIELLEFVKDKTDFIGVNYYASHHIQNYEGESMIHHNNKGEKGSSVYRLNGLGEMVDNPSIPKTDWDWPIFPKGLKEMLIRLHEEYGVKKIYITENGLGDKDKLINEKVHDSNRIDYVHKHLNAILDAIAQGVNVMGYFMWSLMDVFSWTNGYTKRYGFFYVDFKTQKRYIKDSGYWFKNVINHNSLDFRKDNK